MTRDIQELRDEVERLKQQNVEILNRFRDERRRYRVLGSLALAIVVAVIMVSPGNKTAFAQASTTLQELLTRVKRLEHKTQFIHVASSPDAPGYMDTTFDGCNVRIVNGLGTNGSLNGAGNLIVGYGALRNDGTDQRTGSHNLIVGDYNDYTSYGGVVTGASNNSQAPYANVVGGTGSTASGTYSCVSGGSNNNALNSADSVSGGYGNEASGGNSSISGGTQAYAAGQYSSVSGGDIVVAYGRAASVAGGQFNDAFADYSTISGGNHNTANATYSSVSGGYSGVASAISSAVSGGYHVQESDQNGWAGGSLHSP